MSSKSKVNQKNVKKFDNIHDKLRILCLHGYRQNGDAFRSKIGSFRKHTQRYAEFVFIDAPHKIVAAKTVKNLKSKTESKETAKKSKIDQEKTDQNKMENGKIDEEENDIECETDRSWWFNVDNQTFKGPNKNGPAYGFDVSLHYVEEVWRTQGPFHGLLGFSQGACFVGLICSLSMRGMTEIKPQFAILAAGFRSGSLAHLNYYEESIIIPSLHIFGETDTIIPQIMSDSLASVFEEPTIVTHPGGHYFAATSNQRQIYVDFLRNRLVDYLEQKELEQADVIEIKKPIAAMIAPTAGPSTSSIIQSSDDSD